MAESYIFITNNADEVQPHKNRNLKTSERSTCEANLFPEFSRNMIGPHCRLICHGYDAQEKMDHRS